MRRFPTLSRLAGLVLAYMFVVSAMQGAVLDAWTVAQPTSDAAASGPLDPT